MAVGAEENVQPVKVLSTWRSPFGTRVLIALQEKGVQYEYQDEDVPYHKSQLLLDSNPVYKKIPVLIHNGRPLCESLIIVQYIDEVWPSPGDKPAGLLPKDPFERASARFWADYVDKKVTEAVILIMRNVEGSELMEQGKKDLKQSLKALDGALRDVHGAGPFFGGQQIGLVDIALAPFTCFFEVCGSLGNFKVLDAEECPHLFAWAKAVVEVPSVKEALSISPSPKLLESVRMMRKTLYGLEE